MGFVSYVPEKLSSSSPTKKENLISAGFRLLDLVYNKLSASGYHNSSSCLRKVVIAYRRKRRKKVFFVLNVFLRLIFCLLIALLLWLIRAESKYFLSSVTAYPNQLNILAPFFSRETAVNKSFLNNETKKD